jgi:hypothetical protein
MFGKKFEEYFRFDRWILILVGLVFAIRLGLSLSGWSFSQARWVSINLVLLVGLVYSAVAVHTTGFGSYKQLYGLLLLQVSVAHTLIGLAIILAIVTGQDNIFTAPEVFGGQDGKNWFHAILHLVFSPVLAAFSWLIGSLILFVTRKLRP